MVIKEQISARRRPDQIKQVSEAGWGVVRYRQNAGAVYSLPAASITIVRGRIGSAKQ
jgi:hypothetical protein